MRATGSNFERGGITRSTSPVSTFCSDGASKHGESGPDTAAVKLKVERALGPNSFPENFDLPLVLTKDGWRVDVRNLRNMFPGLPR